MPITKRNTLNSDEEKVECSNENISIGDEKVESSIATANSEEVGTKKAGIVVTDEEEGPRHSINNDDEEEDTDGLTEDIYSFIFTAKYKSTAFIYAFCVFLFQASLIFLIMFDLIDPQNTDNPLGVPPGVSKVVTTAQAFAMLLAATYQDDVITALIMLHRGYKIFDFIEFKGRSLIHPFKQTTCIKWFLSSMLQFFVGCGLLVVIFILIVKSESVIGMMLNFAALSFVSEIDDIAFAMGKRGFVTNAIQREANRVTNYKVPNPRRKSSNIFRRVLFFIVFAGLMTGYGIIVHQQKSGRFICNAIRVQFSDDYYRAASDFTGVYYIQEGRHISGRAVYLRSGSENVMLAYCKDLQRWTFTTWMEDTEIARKHFDNDWLYKKNDPCKWFAMSPETETFDVTTTAESEWLVLYEKFDEPRPFSSFAMKCNDCKTTGDGGSCRGDCVDNRCVCNNNGTQFGSENQFGVDCEFSYPCPTLALDKRGTTFPSNVLGDRFTLLVDENEKPVLSNNRPVWVNATNRYGAFVNIIIGNGRRWIAGYYNYKALGALLMSYNITSDGENVTMEDFARYISGDTSGYYEGYLSILEHNAGRIEYISEPVDIGSYKDTFHPTNLKWFRTTNTGPIPNTADENNPIESILICGHCSNETNKCFNGGICINHDGRGECDCPIGFSGVLCENEDRCSSLLDHDSDELQQQQLGCFNNGTCNQRTGICSCSGSFYGRLCQFNDDG